MTEQIKTIEVMGEIPPVPEGCGKPFMQYDRKTYDKGYALIEGCWEPFVEPTNISRTIICLPQPKLPEGWYIDDEGTQWSIDVRVGKTKEVSYSKNLYPTETEAILAFNRMVGHE